ncbi:MAG: Lnb N-terminal periplasmic domain-containing protein [Elusimicrobiota bacterium]
MPFFAAAVLSGLIFSLASPSRAQEISPQRTAPSADARRYLARLEQRARNLHLAQNKNWLNLLHYEPTPLGRHGEISPGPFYLSPQGRKNPEAELAASLAAFFKSAHDPDLQAQCRFPARYAWLASRLNFNPLKLAPKTCPALSRWRQKLDADSVSAVFADAYMDNPSSMYGHTFLLFHHRDRPPADRLLDYAVNFAARTKTKNGALFAVDGLIGVFPGRFSAMPYYLKVQQYANLESRDLWEYRLSLSSTAVARLADHLWELGDASFPYYFFNRNCSYQLLPLLDVADPKLRLGESWPLYVIPADTVRAIKAVPGLVAGRTYRPSHVSRMFFDRSLLSPAEVKIAGDLARSGRGWKRLRALSAPNRARTLASSGEYLEYLIDYQKNADPKLLARQRRIYLSLAGTGDTVPELPVPPPDPPESGHLSGRMSLGYGTLNGRSFEDFAIRPALHDPLDSPRGYVPWSALEMFDLDLRHEDKADRTYVNSLDLVHILSLSPLDPWIKKPSWEVDAGLRQAEDLGKAPWASQYFGLTIGSGVSIRAPYLPAALYALAEIDGGGGAAFRDGYRLGPEVRGGLLFNPANRWRVDLDAAFYDYALGNPGTETRLRLGGAYDFSKNWSARLNIERYGLAREASLGVVRYFQ